MGTNRTALITDAFHPAAAAIAARLESEGITVINNYPRQSNKSNIAEFGNGYAFDTWSLVDMKRLLDMIISKRGDVNYLIHTDNVILRARLEDITEQDFKKALDYNAKSAFITTKVFGEHMAQKGDGTIIYLSTLHDEKPTGCAFAYSTAKGAVKMLCKEMALFYGRKGIRANCEAGNARGYSKCCNIFSIAKKPSYIGSQHHRGWRSYPAINNTGVGWTLSFSRHILLKYE